MRKIYLLLLFAGLLGHTSRAQLLLGYQFQAQASTYTPLGAGATRLPALEADEAIAGAVPLGFTFVARGRFFTQAGISSNGWMALAQTALTSPSPNSYLMNYSGEGDITIAPLWADLSGSGGMASYQTTGTAPGRVFTMEWRDFRWDRQATQATVSFQVRLYEGANRIEFSYRPEAGSVNNGGNNSGARAGLALRDYGYTYVAYEPLMLSDLSTAPQLNFNNGGPGTLLKPATGQLYRFTPSPNTIPACVGAVSYTMSRLGHTSARVTWTLTPLYRGGAVRVHYGPRGFVLGSAADQVALGVRGDSAQLTGLVPDTDYEYLGETMCGAGAAPVFSGRTAFRTYTPPSNDEASRAIWVPVLNAPRQARLTPGFCQDASTSLPANPNCTQPSGVVRDVWYAFHATETSHRVVVSSGGQPGTFVVEVRDGYSTLSRSLACGVSPTPLSVSGLTVGRSYLIRLYPRTPLAYSYFELGVISANAAVPANDNCSAAQVLAVAPAPEGLPATSGTVRNATASGLGSFGVGACGVSSGGPSKDVFYRFVAAGAAAEVQLRPGFRAGLEVMTSCSSAPLSSQSCVMVEANKLGRFPLASLTPGQTYYLRVYNQSEAVLLDDPTFTIAVSAPAAPPANDDCAGALPLPVTALTVAGATGTLLGATASGLLPAPTACYSVPSGSTSYTPPATARDVWYQFTATAATHVLQLTSRCAAVAEVLSSSGSPCASGATVQRLACAVARMEHQSIVAEDRALPGRLLLPNLTVGSVYWVRVFPLEAGTATRPEGDLTFQLSLSNWAPPANDDPAAATPVVISPTDAPCANPAAFTLDGATPTLATAPGALTERDVWFSFVAPAATAGSPYARVLLRMGTNSQFILQGGMQLRDGTSPGSTLLAGDAWGTGGRTYNAGMGYTSLIPGRTYYIRVYSSLPNPESHSQYDFCLTTQLNDEPCDALSLPVSSLGQCTQPVRGTTLFATPSTTTPGLAVVVPNCGYTFNQSRDVWFRVVPTSAALVIRSDDATVGMARLYQSAGVGGACTGPLQLVNCQSTLGADYNEHRAFGSILFDNLTAGRPYYLAISNDNSSFAPTGLFTLCAQASGPLPVRPEGSSFGMSLWPNPIEIGELLNVRLPADLAATAEVYIEWLSAVGQPLPALAPGHVRPAGGVLRVPTAGRAPGLYLLRLRLPNGQPLPAQRVVLQ